MRIQNLYQNEVGLYQECMLKARAREAISDKVVDRTVEVVGRSDGENITDFLATLEDVLDLKQIACFKCVADPRIRDGVVKIQYVQTT